MQKPLKRVMIIIEETGEEIHDDKGPDGGPSVGFQVRLSGDTEKFGKGLPSAQLSAAEFWGFKLFDICRNALIQAGAANPK